MRLKYFSILIASQLLTSVSAHADTIKPTGTAKPMVPGSKVVTLPNGEKVTIPPMPKDPPKLTVPPDNSLWFRYYQAGEDAMLKHDTELEKKYLMASLGELEKVKSADSSDLMFLVKISAVEQYLEGCYPSDWSKAKGSDAEVMKQRSEQVSTYYRIAKINERFVSKDDLLRTKSMERYQNVRRDYEKALADAKSGTKKANDQTAQ